MRASASNESEEASTSPEASPSEEVEQPPLIDMGADQVKEAYGIDTKLLADFTVMAPLMNVKTNEIAIFKVKNVKDIAMVKKGIKKCAADIQKSFEDYLQDQYENAKNYKIVTNGDYVLFLISESAEDLEKAFQASFGKK